MHTKHEELGDLDPRLVFHRFSLLAEKREALYHDFIEIDEKDEISTSWVEFSGDVVKELLLVIKLTKSFYERIVDGIRRSPEKPSEEELERIKKLTEFWLDLSIMSYLYCTIEKRGVFDQAGTGKYNESYLETKNSIDELIFLAFQTGADFFYLDSRITLGELLYLYQEKSRLDFWDTIGGDPEEKKRVLGDYDLKQALFLLNRVKPRLIQSSLSWHFKDPIAMHSATEHAISHIESMCLHWENCTSDLVTKGEQFTKQFMDPSKSFSDLSLAQHYKRLGIAALQQRGTSIASTYFREAVKLTERLGAEDVDLRDNSEFWGDTIQEQHLLYLQMTHLCDISSKYQSILKYLNENNLKEIQILIEENLDNLHKILSLGDLAYISSVAIAYESIFSYLKEQISLGANISSMRDFIEKRMDMLADRLRNASNQISKSWLRVLKKDGNNIPALEEIVKNLELPLLALFVLPPNSEIVVPATSELLAIQRATEALMISLKADSEFAANPVKEMLMRVRTYQFAQEAVVLLGNVPNEEIINIIKEILEPIKQSTLLRGLIAEVQLRTAVLQYQFVNKIAPLIESSALLVEGTTEGRNDSNELLSFQSDLEEINIAGKTILENKLPILINNKPINWNIFTNLFFLSQGLIDVLEIIKLTATAQKSKDREDKIEALDKAKDLAFSAADTISKGQSQEASQLGQQVYSLGQFLSEMENKVRGGQKMGDIPIGGILELVQSLVMSI